jgi:hypothetical protein
VHYVLSSTLEFCYIIDVTNTMENCFACVFVFILHLDDMNVLVVDLNDIILVV